jgi:hypothetical protein
MASKAALHIHERPIADCAKADSEYGAGVAAAPAWPNGRLEVKNILGSYGSEECHWVGDGFPVRSVLCYGSLGAQISPVSIAPGTAKIGHGGFTYYQGRDLLKEVATRSEVMGVDFADVSPPYDPCGFTALLAARLSLDFIQAIFHERTKRDA